MNESRFARPDTLATSRILDLLARGPMSTRDLAPHVPGHPAHLRRCVMRLRNAGLATPVGKLGRDVSYRLASPGLSPGLDAPEEPDPPIAEVRRIEARKDAVREFAAEHGPQPECRPGAYLRALDRHLTGKGLT